MHYIVVCSYPVTQRFHLRGFNNLSDALAYASDARIQNAKDIEELKAIGINPVQERTVAVFEGYQCQTMPALFYSDVDESQHKA